MEEAILKVQRQFSQEPPQRTSSMSLDDEPANDLVLDFGDDDDYGDNGFGEDQNRRSVTPPVKSVTPSSSRVPMKTPSPVHKPEHHHHHHQSDSHRKRKISREVIYENKFMLGV